MNPIATLFRSMEGTWTFHRVISGHGTIQGRAQFKRCPLDELSRLNYREEGEFTAQSGNLHSVFQEYVYRYQKGNISVYLADDTPFYTLGFQSLKYPITATAEHLCACDTYSASYVFLDGRFKLAYKVLGPSKDYMIVTEFNKVLESKI